MLKKFKFDVSISVAEEDLPIAQKIVQSLRSRKITYYFYHEQGAQNWGEHILKISLARYGAEARFVLVIISKTYTEKYWAGIESQIMQTFGTKKEAYILPIRIDDAPMDGISKYLVYEKWNDNQEEIAVKIQKKLRLRRQKANKRFILAGALTLMLLVAFNFIVSYTRVSPDYSSYIQYAQQGDSLVQKNNFAEAKKVYQRALQYNRQDPAVARKLALLDSADRFIGEKKLAEAQKLFQVIINIPVSPGLSTQALLSAGVHANPPLTISIKWNGGALQIIISGGVPFDDEQQPYKIEGIECKDCIQWKKTGSQYTALVAGKEVRAGPIRLKDRVGQFANRDVPVNPAPPVEPASNTAGTPPLHDRSNEELFAGYLAAGDSLFAAGKYEDAKNEYLQGRALKPADAGTASKIAACDDKIKAAEEMAAKNIPHIPLTEGSFTMGTDNGNPEDGPSHAIALHSFSISTTEVTVAQYRRYCQYRSRPMPPAPSYGWTDDLPITNITWAEAAAYCEWVGGRLPSEAEWEYAAHAGTSTLYSGSDQPDRVAWYSSNAGNKPARVGHKTPNAFGIYDMTGNVSEWCADWYNRKYYAQSTGDNPPGPASGNEKVVRGGAYNSYVNSTQDGNQLRITYRNSETPGSRKPYIGFRVAWNK